MRVQVGCEIFLHYNEIRISNVMMGNALSADFVKFWAGLGWLANLFTIVIAFITVGSTVYGALKIFRRYFGRNRKTFSSVLGYIKSEGLGLSLDALKKKKIAIVDDQPENYPIEYLRSRGFLIDSYEQVSLSNYSFIERYDLIFLDITNVVKEDLKRGGFELIKRVKSEMPEVVVVGVSSKRFDPTLTEFFNLADEQAKTPITEKECEDLVVRVLLKHYSSEHISSEIDAYLNDSNLSYRERKKILRNIIHYVKGRFTESEFLKASSSLLYKIDIHELLRRSRLLREMV